MRQATVVLPNWATTTPVSAGAYRKAVLRPDLLVALPCFCGCVSYAPAHRSLYDCFVRPDGAFETHAADFAGLPVVTDEGVRLEPPAWAERLQAAQAGYLFLDELSTTHGYVCRRTLKSGQPPTG